MRFGQRLLSTIAPAAAAALAVLQWIPAAPAFNPPARQWQTLEANIAAVPPHVARILGRACGNCHSNQTRLPWYGRVAPASWIILRDVHKARAAMNFSSWTTSPGRKPSIAAATLAAACADVKTGRMPPAPYRMLHPESRLGQADKQDLCEWANHSSHELLSRGGHVETVTAAAE